MVIRAGGDDGTPIVAAEPDGDYAKAYRAIAEKIWKKVGSGASQPDAPNISIE
jgi:ATP-binding protein involved in chromosome partitioning